MATKNADVASTAGDDVDAAFAQAASAQAYAEDPFAGMDDLLDSVVEDDSEGWVPKEKGEGIMGVVLAVGQIKSDFASDTDPDPMCPTVTLQTKPTPEQAAEGKGGDKFRVIGYGAVLKRELREKDPQVGDVMAVKYFGEGILKTGKFAGRKFKNFGVVVMRKPA